MRKCLILLLVLIFTVPAMAQDDTGTETPFVPFVSFPLNVQGLRPDGWIAQRNAEGIFVRNAEPGDLTALIMQSQDVAKEEFLDSVALSFAVDELEIIDSFESAFLHWDIYQFSRTEGEQELIIDMAVAEDEVIGRVYYALLQTDIDSYEALHDEIFMATLTWMSPMQFYDDPNGLYSIPVPIQWEITETEEFTQLADPEANILVMVKAVEGDSPIIATEDFLATINPDFDQGFNPELHILSVIDEPERIGELDAVYLIDWVDSSLEEVDGFFLQTVSRVYNGVIYMTAIIGNVDTLGDYEVSIALVDNGFIITELADASDVAIED